MTTGQQAGGKGRPAAAKRQPIKTFDGDKDQPTTKAGFEDLVKRAISNLADVTVATLVTDVTVQIDERGRLEDVSVPTTDIAAIVSNINLVNGNATTEIANSLKDDEALRTFHQGLVDKAVTVLPNNIEAFAKLVEEVIGKII